MLYATVLELPENHSVPERTIDLRAHGQLESIDFLNLNHFTRRGLRSPRGSLIVSCALTDMASRPILVLRTCRTRTTYLLRKTVQTILSILTCGYMGSQPEPNSRKITDKYGNTGRPVQEARRVQSSAGSPPRRPAQEARPGRPDQSVTRDQSPAVKGAEAPNVLKISL